MTVVNNCITITKKTLMTNLIICITNSYFCSRKPSILTKIESSKITTPQPSAYSPLARSPTTLLEALKKGMEKQMTSSSVAALDAKGPVARPNNLTGRIKKLTLCKLQ